MSIPAPQPPTAATQQALVVVPTPANNLVFHVFMAELAQQRGAERVAAGQYAQAAKLGTDPALAAHATLLAYRQKDDALALALNRRWLELAPGDSAALHVQAVLNTRFGHTQQAIQEFQQLLGKAPGANLMLTGEMLEEETRPQQSLPVMRQLVSRYPHLAEAHYALAHLALHAEQSDLAVSEARLAVKLKPEWSAAVVLQANALLAQGHGEAAVQLLHTHARGQPDDRELHLAYAAMLAETGHAAQACTEFSAVLKHAPSNPDALYSLGLLALQSNQLSSAHAYFERLLATGQRNNDAFYFLGSTAEISKRYAEALKRYQRVDGGRYWFPAQIASVRVLLAEGKADAARRYIDARVAADSEDGAQFRLQEAQLFNAVGDTHGALDIFARGLTEYPGDDGLLYGRALLHESLGNVAAAETDLRAILAHAPDNADALNAFGYILTVHTTRYQEALGYIQRAWRLKPDDSAILDSLGWVEFRLGNVARAVSELRRAYARSPDPDIAAHLIEALWAAGERQAARSVWSRALKQHPGNAALAKLAARFSQ